MHNKRFFNKFQIIVGLSFKLLYIELNLTLQIIKQTILYEVNLFQIPIKIILDTESLLSFEHS